MGKRNTSKRRKQPPKGVAIIRPCAADGCNEEALPKGRYCRSCGRALSLAAFRGGLPEPPRTLPASVREYREPEAAMPYLPIARRKRGAKG